MRRSGRQRLASWQALADSVPSVFLNQVSHGLDPVFLRPRRHLVARIGDKARALAPEVEPLEDLLGEHLQRDVWEPEVWRDAS